MGVILSLNLRTPLFPERGLSMNRTGTGSEVGTERGTEEKEAGPSVTEGGLETRSKKEKSGANLSTSPAGRSSIRVSGGTPRKGEGVLW